MNTAGLVKLFILLAIFGLIGDGLLANVVLDSCGGKSAGNNLVVETSLGQTAIGECLRELS